MPRAARNNYELSQEAVDDISAALIYLENESPQAADRLQSILIEAFERLAKWPESGHRRSDLTDRTVRFWSAGTISSCTGLRTTLYRSSLSCTVPVMYRRSFRNGDQKNRSLLENRDIAELPRVSMLPIACKFDCHATQSSATF